MARTVKMTWAATLGIAVLAAFDPQPARSEPLTIAPPATVDSFTFASFSSRTRPDARIRVYPVGAPDNPLMLRGYHLAPWGVRGGLAYAPGRSATRSEPLRWDEIERVEVKRTSATLGAAIGAATLGAFYLALAIRTSSANGGAEGSQFLWIYGVGTAVSVDLGRIIGKRIGSRSQQWESVYVSRPLER